MATITKIEQQKRNKARVNLYIDGSFFCAIFAETAIKNGLKTGQEVDEDYLKELVSDSEKRKAMDYCLLILAKKPYTKYEIKTKLAGKGYDNEIVFSVIKKLTEYNYLSDEEFANNYANSCGTKSAKQIEQKLAQKGVAREIIENAVKSIKLAGESDKIAQITAKYMKNKPKTDDTFNKLFRYLAGKGFNFEEIKTEIRRWKEDESWD